MIISTTSYSPFPKKIISLVPSITELLYHLHLDTETIGITKFCVHPSIWHKNKEKVGGTKNININKIIELAPDLIICNKEENVKEQVEEIAKLFPVYLSDVSSYESALQMITEVGKITNRKIESENIVEEIVTAFEKEITTTVKNKRVAYLIWKDPYMTIGGDTFINDMLEKIGFKNIYNDYKRYPQITLEDLQHVKPEVILLSSEPYPFKEKHIAELKNHFSTTNILLADGEMFSWYGSRMLLMPAYFNRLLLDLEK